MFRADSTSATPIKYDVLLRRSRGFVHPVLPSRHTPHGPRFELKNTAPLDGSADRYTVALGRVETRSLRAELLETVLSWRKIN